MRIFIAYLFVITFYLLVGCSAQKHYTKFLKKGGQINCIKDTLLVIDTLVLDGDTLYTLRREIVVKDSISYKTRWQTRFEYKTIKEQGKTKRVYIRQNNKSERKQIKQVQKTERSKNKWWLWLLIGFILAYVFRYSFIIIKAFNNIPLKK